MRQSLAAVLARIRGVFAPLAAAPRPVRRAIIRAAIGLAVATLIAYNVEVPQEVQAGLEIFLDFVTSLAG